MKQGTIVDGRFRIDARIGVGGMAHVFRADDLQTGSVVAVKIMTTDAPGAFVRFEREARALAELSHPNVVRHVAHNMIDQETAYLAVELLEGEDLRKRLQREELAMEDSLIVARQVASALGAVHQRGMVHRDVKPGNIFLVHGDPRNVKLLDFGIAFRYDASHAVTATGMILGTPGYLAPEVARSAEQVDARADVFSLGTVLFRCLAGRPAYDGNDIVAVLAKLVFDETPRLKDVRPDIPGAIDALVAKMMAKQKDERPADGSAVVLALDSIGVVHGNAPSTTSNSRAKPHHVPQSTSEVVAEEEPSAANTAMTWALTGEERILRCVIMIEGARQSAAMDIRASLDKIMNRFGAEMARLSDGSIVISLSGQGGAIMDQAGNAARCALAVRSLVPDREMVLATGRSKQGAGPIGELIDRAATLLREAIQAAAKERQDKPDQEFAGHIRLDPMSYGLLGPSFEVGGDALSLFLVSERHPLEASVRTLLGKPTPCVGRERELSLLTGLWRECIDESVARAAVVTSAVGLGKSRLRYEFLRQVLGQTASSPTSTDVWVARGDPMGAGSSFRVLWQLVRHAVGILEGEPLDVRRRKLLARVGRHFRGADRGRIAEFLGELCGTPMIEKEASIRRAPVQNSMLLGDQLRRAWEDFVGAVTAENPVLLVVEDLQWGDNASLQVLDGTLRNLADRPLMVLGLGRPEVDALFPNLWNDRGVQEIRLHELRPKASERLVREVLGNAVSAETVAAIVTRAEGNAFFLEEMIRAVAEGRGSEMPSTVLAMVEASLDRLSSETRRVLRAASVFGQTFWENGVNALLGEAEPGGRIAGLLDHLQRQEMVTERRASRFPGQREFVFRHALVRDAAYSMLTEEDARLGHSLAGMWLERVGEVDAAVMAEHFERGGDHSLAAWWYMHAAAQSLAGNDFASVIKRVDRGLALGADRLVAGELWRSRAEALRWLGDNSEAEKACIEALKYLEPGSGSWLATAPVLATVASRTGQHERLLSIAAEVERSSSASEPNAAVMAYAKIAIQLVHAGHLREANSLLHAAEGTLQGIAAPEAWATGPVHQLRAIRSMFAGDVGAFMQSMQLAARDFEAAGDLRSAWTQHANVAYALIELGAYAQANDLLQQAVVFADRMGLKDLGAGSRHNLGMALAHLGQLEEARTMERLALRVAVALKNRRLESGCRTYLAMILFLSGDLEGAEREARAAADMLSAAPPIRAHALGILGRILVRAGRPEEALAATTEAVALMRGAAGIEEGESMIALGHVEALGALGRIQEQRDVLSYVAARLQERASHISDPALREGFLYRVPENARVMALASAIRTR